MNTHLPGPDDSFETNAHHVLRRAAGGGGLQMVQPLRGAHGFKETGRYSPGVALGAHKLGTRLAAFPFIGEMIDK